MSNEIKPPINDPTSTKKCPNCQSDKIVHFSSLSYRLCHTCGHTYPWLIEKGQKKII